jgi:hypothetical protein
MTGIRKATVQWPAYTDASFSGWGWCWAGIVAASIHDEIFTKHDPYRLMFGTIACGETWMWQEEGFGLGMDVMMKEGYGGGVGGGQFVAEGTPKNLRDYPMTLEPLWGMADPGAKGSALWQSRRGCGHGGGADDADVQGHQH